MFDDRIPAVLYGRVSTVNQVKGTSLESQLEIGTRTAEREGAYIAYTCMDEGVSGDFYNHRPKVQEAVGHVESGRAKMLIIANVDRGGRAVEVIRDIRKRVQRAGGILVFADTGRVEDTSVATMNLTFQAAVAEYNKARILEKGKEGRQRRAESGIQPCRNRHPWGYHIVTNHDVIAGRYPASELGKYHLVEEQAKWIPQMYQRCADGESLRSIARWLDSEGVPTPGGARQWDNGIVLRILRHPVNKGTAPFGRKKHQQDESRLTEGYKSPRFYTHADESEWIYIPAPALVSETVWDAVQARLDSNQQRIGGNPRQVYLLSGLVSCPFCGVTMTGLTTQSHYESENPSKSRFYRCAVAHGKKVQRGVRVCDCGYHNAASLERLVREAIIYAATEPQAIEAAKDAWKARETPTAPQEERIASLRAQLHDLSAKEAATVRAQVDGVLSGADPAAYRPVFEDIAARRKGITEEILTLQESLPSKGERPRLPDVPEVLARLSDRVRYYMNASEEQIPTAQKRETIAGVIEKIIPRRSEQRGNAKVESAEIYLADYDAEAMTDSGGGVTSRLRLRNGARSTILR